MHCCSLSYVSQGLEELPCCHLQHIQMEFWQWLSRRRPAVLLPISLPDMDGLLIHIVVFQSLFVQEVKEIFDSRWHHCPGAQHAAEEVIHKLLQCSLKGATNNVRQGTDREQSQKYQSPETQLSAPSVREDIWVISENIFAFSAPLKTQP